ncbi:helix-turn-helix domain-containing protein [Streptomyces sp. NPDC050095]|uniref:ArsR/SmtB family transcription factor n=1 Tax=unclassified Streptomyces TaxID=2593676 RepID=UPI00341BCBE8
MDEPTPPPTPPSSEPTTPKVRNLDARSLRGLAHPLRMRMLDSLRYSGPATASQLAAKLGESSGATSYHLRQLAEYGFVEDAPEHGKGRERWWKAVYSGTVFDSALLKDEDPEVRGAADFFLHEVATMHARQLSTWLGSRDAWGKAWDDATDVSSWTLRLTPELTKELTEKMHELLESYRDLAVTKGDPQAEQVRIHTHAFPIHTD